MRNAKGENGCTCKPGPGRHWFGCPVHVRAMAGQQARLEARAAIRRTEGAKLRALRIARGLSCSQLMAAVGLKHRQHISQIESGTTRMPSPVRVWLEANEQMA